MINKSLKKILTDGQVKISNLKVSSRPSEISPETYYKITELTEKN